MQSVSPRKWCFLCSIFPWNLLASRGLRRTRIGGLTQTHRFSIRAAGEHLLLTPGSIFRFSHLILKAKRSPGGLRYWCTARLSLPLWRQPSNPPRTVRQKASVISRLWNSTQARERKTSIKRDFWSFIIFEPHL